MGETARFKVEIILSTTEDFELPMDDEVERMIKDQMAGDLGGFECIAVELIERSGELDTSFDFQVRIVSDPEGDGTVPSHEDIATAIMNLSDAYPIKEVEVQ